MRGCSVGDSHHTDASNPGLFRVPKCNIKKNYAGGTAGHFVKIWFTRYVFQNKPDGNFTLQKWVHVLCWIYRMVPSEFLYLCGHVLVQKLRKCNLHRETHVWKLLNVTLEDCAHGLFRGRNTVSVKNMNRLAPSNTRHSSGSHMHSGTFPWST